MSPRIVRLDQHYLNWVRQNHDELEGKDKVEQFFYESDVREGIVRAGDVAPSSQNSSQKVASTSEEGKSQQKSYIPHRGLKRKRERAEGEGSECTSYYTRKRICKYR